MLQEEMSKIFIRKYRLVVCGSIKVFAFVIFLFSILVACTKQYSMEERKKILIGEYSLYVGTNQTIRHKNLLSSKLILQEDGIFIQSCIYKDDNELHSRGTWRYDDKVGELFITDFLDCAGVNPIPQKSSGNLVLSFTKRPIILLNPDANVFYEKETNQRKSGKTKGTAP